MGLTTLFFGGFMGTGIHMFANAVQKVPLSRKPWCHVGFFIGGAMANNYMYHWEKDMAVSINNRRIANGFPPLVGSGGWNPLGSIYKEDVTMNETK
mmetsp:Transcript_3775/g.4120  ORF Transcript_3775/g.4120 Transcript_3775/m.4120 type:complete len:96 (+) Transcript_3775:85-372(+)